MRKMILVLLALLMVAALPALAQENSDSKITLERTACFGMCPVYTVTIYADGRVVYDGQQFVDVEGAQEINIGADAFEELMQVIEDAGYFDWNDDYTEIRATDQPSAISTVTRDGETKQINHYMGDDSAPLELSFVENWIDYAAGTQQWTGKAPSLPHFTSAGSALITLERTPCFGTCPAYKLVIYEDGTVVFLGYRFVAATGIHIGHIEADDVQALIDDISKAGFFEWDSEYLDQSVTDLPYVYVMVLGKDGYNDIAHYLGDNSAPEELTVIEEKIDAAVNVSQWIDAPDAEATPEATDMP